MVAVKVTNQRRCGSNVWECICDCGILFRAAVPEIRAGKTKSCGCLAAETRIANNAAVRKFDGTRRYPEYAVWNTMKHRCLNPKNKKYPLYGGRGITVCDRWIKSFWDFLSDMGRRPLGMTIERINNDGNYESGNCKWATWLEQAQNRRIWGTSGSPGAQG